MDDRIRGEGVICLQRNSFIFNAGVGCYKYVVILFFIVHGVAGVVTFGIFIVSGKGVGYDIFAAWLILDFERIYMHSFFPTF